MRFVGMFFPRVYLELLQHGAGQLVLGKHSFYRIGDEEFRALLSKIRYAPVFLTTHVAAVKHVFLLLFLGPGKLYLGGVGYDDVVTRIGVGRIDRLVPTAQGVGDLNRQPAKYLVGGIHNLPIVGGGFRFC